MIIRWTILRAAVFALFAAQQTPGFSANISATVNEKSPLSTEFNNDDRSSFYKAVADIAKDITSFLVKGNSAAEKMASRGLERPIPPTPNKYFLYSEDQTDKNKDLSPVFEAITASAASVAERRTGLDKFKNFQLGTESTISIAAPEPESAKFMPQAEHIYIIYQIKSGKRLTRQYMAKKYGEDFLATTDPDGSTVYSSASLRPTMVSGTPLNKGGRVFSNPVTSEPNKSPFIPTKLTYKARLVVDEGLSPWKKEAKIASGGALSKPKSVTPEIGIGDDSGLITVITRGGRLQKDAWTKISLPIFAPQDSREARIYRQFDGPLRDEYATGVSLRSKALETSLSHLKKEKKLQMGVSWHYGKGSYTLGVERPDTPRDRHGKPDLGVKLSLTRQI